LPASRVIPNPQDADVETNTWDINTCRKDSLLFVGRFDRRKGGDLVLRVFSELAASYSSLILTFVGSDRGIIQADGTIWSFENFVRHNFPDWLRSRIEFRGEMNHSGVMSIRREHFATIIGSQYEIMPYSVLEAMSVGCPIVVTAVGGIPELIRDEQNGLLVPSQDIKAMIVACKKLLDNRTFAVRLGRQAWRDCRQFYRPDDMAKQTVAAYEQAIDNFKLRKI
jgi:glycosyltransferase involved in cell wall biosynthesis